MKSGIRLLLSAFGLFLFSADFASAQAVDANGYASDVSVSVTFTGSMEPGLPFSGTLNPGPLNTATGTAPPYLGVASPTIPIGSSDVTLLPGPGLGGFVFMSSGSLIGGPGPGLATLSDVDGASGARFAESAATMPRGGLTVGTGSTSVLTVFILEGSTPVSSEATVSWDGTSLSTTASSDLVSTRTPAEIAVEVMGLPLTVPAFPVGSPSVIIPVTVSTALGTITGSVSLMADVVSIVNDGITASVTATSLLVDFDLDVSVLDAVATYTTSVEGTMEFNSTHASMTVVPVPEPTGAVLLLAGSILSGLRRRRA